MISILNYKTFPPPNHDNTMAPEIVPAPYVLSIKSVVNSPYTTIDAGNGITLIKVNIAPQNITNKSHFVAKRYCKKKMIREQSKCGIIYSKMHKFN